MKKLVLAIIFAICHAFYLHAHIHTLTTYKPFPKSIFDNNSDFVKFFLEQCTMRFEYVSISFAMLCEDLHVVYAVCNDYGAVLYMDKRRNAAFIEYFNPINEGFSLFKESFDKYLSMSGFVEGVEEMEDILV